MDINNNVININDVVERMKQATKTSNNADLAKYLGNSKNAVSNWKAINKKPLKECIEISSREGVSIEWLLTGEHPDHSHIVHNISKIYQNIIQQNKHKKLSPDDFSYLMRGWYSAALHTDIDQKFIENGLTTFKLKPSDIKAKSDYHPIAIYDINASAGSGSFVENEEQTGVLSLSDTYLRNELNIRPKDAIIIFVTGDSMEPTLRSGDPILIDKSINVIVADGIYVLRVDDVVHVKRVQKNIDSSIEIISDNSAYKTFLINKTSNVDINIIGRVVLNIKKM